MANLQPLCNYIRQNISHLRASPCLIISSSPPPNTVSTAIAGTKSPSSISSDTKQQKEQSELLKLQQQQNDPRIHSFVERNTQSITLEYNLPAVSCHISSAFPTIQTVHETISLAKRAGLKEGGGVIIGLGSGAAIDLSKAVADTLFNDNISPFSKSDDTDGGGASLVLAPATLGGLLSATSNSPSILLDTKEEMLLPYYSTPSWGNVANCRQRTVVTMDDPTKYLALPPLYTPFQPIKGSEYRPSMSHYAAAALTIILDVARSLDMYAEAEAEGTTSDSNAAVSLKQSVTNEMKVVATSCASVLELAARESKSDNDATEGNDTKLAQQYLLGAIPRLAAITQQSSLLTQLPITATGGTIPQKLANALLPKYFPQCHLVTYLACTLPGLADALEANGASSSSGRRLVETVSRSITNSSTNSEISSLSSWASQVTTDAGVPTMASLAYGTPDLTTLVGSLDSYHALVTSVTGGGSRLNDYGAMEDILQRSLHR